MCKRSQIEITSGTKPKWRFPVANGGLLSQKWGRCNRFFFGFLLLLTHLLADLLTCYADYNNNDVNTISSTYFNANTGKGGNSSANSSRNGGVINMVFSFRMEKLLAMKISFNEDDEIFIANNFSMRKPQIDGEIVGNDSEVVGDNGVKKIDGEIVGNDGEIVGDNGVKKIDSEVVGNDGEVVDGVKKRRKNPNKNPIRPTINSEAVRVKELKELIKDIPKNGDFGLAMLMEILHDGGLDREDLDEKIDNAALPRRNPQFKKLKPWENRFRNVGPNCRTGYRSNIDISNIDISNIDISSSSLSSSSLLSPIVGIMGASWSQYTNEYWVGLFYGLCEKHHRELLDEGNLDPDKCIIPLTYQRAFLELGRRIIKFLWALCACMRALAVIAFVSHPFGSPEDWMDEYGGDWPTVSNSDREIAKKQYNLLRIRLDHFIANVDFDTTRFDDFYSNKIVLKKKTALNKLITAYGKQSSENQQAIGAMKNNLRSKKPRNIGPFDPTPWKEHGLVEVWKRWSFKKGFKRDKNFTFRGIYEEQIQYLLANNHYTTWEQAREHAITDIVNVCMAHTGPFQKNGQERYFHFTRKDSILRMQNSAVDNLQDVFVFFDWGQGCNCCGCRSLGIPHIPEDYNEIVECNYTYFDMAATVDENFKTLKTNLSQKESPNFSIWKRKFELFVVEDIELMGSGVLRKVVKENLAYFLKLETKNGSTTGGDSGLVNSHFMRPTVEQGELSAGPFPLADAPDAGYKIDFSREVSLRKAVVHILINVLGQGFERANRASGAAWTLLETLV